MADAALLHLVERRLSDAPPGAGAAALVVAALSGPDALDAALEGHAPDGRRPRGATLPAPPAAVYLTSIAVEGFRGVGPPSTLTIAPGPGLTLVVGRNGSGKSSFAEAVEMLLLGTNRRWAGRSKVWTDGWQNLHHRHSRIGATFSVDGRRAALTLTREWAAGSPLEGSRLRVDGREATLDELGWGGALSSFPPLLSHNELEHVLDEGPSKLYDALAGILGLGDLAGAQRSLRERRLALEQLSAQAKHGAEQVRAILGISEDERAEAARRALDAKVWDVGSLERLAGGAADVDERSALTRLRNLASLPVLDSTAVSAAVAELRAAHSDLARRSETESARAHELARLLEQALTVHSHAEDQTCPVCGTTEVLTYEWRLLANERVAELRSAATAIDVELSRLGRATRDARQLVTALPVAVRDGGGLGADVEPVRVLWETWSQLPDGDDPLRIANHLEVHGSSLGKAIAALRKQAAAELERRETSWRPAAQALAEWLPPARRAQEAAGVVQRLREAERWLRDAHDELRDERFRPIADAVQANWTELRQDSSVHLGELRLEGASTQRRLTLDVRVDGEPGSALGVMSQGELNCLALSLFLPRASLPASPFHFVLVDDPVQAMDPAKVEGLAAVLARTAKSRQVVVLTHDDRLADAVRFLQIDATVIEVTRREHSEVELRRIHDPVQRYIDDAFAVAKTEELPVPAARVVPGFCRMALEAAASESATRRMLREGRRHADVQAALQIPTTLNMWLALALLKDAQRAGEVAHFLEKHHAWAVDCVRECNRGAHTGTVIRDPIVFIRSVERLATLLREQFSA